MIFVLVRELAAAQSIKDLLDRFYFRGNQQNLPKVLPFNILKAITRQRLASFVKPNNPSFTIKDNHQTRNRLQHRRVEIAFLMQRSFCLLLRG